MFAALRIILAPNYPGNALDHREQYLASVEAWEERNLLEHPSLWGPMPTPLNFVWNE